MTGDTTNTTSTTPSNVSPQSSESAVIPTLEQVNLAAEKLKEAVAMQKAENDRAEKLYAMQKLGGMSGAPNVQPPKVETPKEYADRVMSGKAQVKRE